MYAAEIVVHEIKRERVPMILKFLRECVGESRESAHLHPHREVLSFDIASRDVMRIWVASDRSWNRADALSWAVSDFLFSWVCAVEFYE